MSVKCDKCCIANFRGKCVNESCEGVLIGLDLNKSLSRERRRKLYKIAKEMFEEDFGEAAYES